MNIILLIVGLNFVVFSFLLYQVIKVNKRESYAVITNKYGESIDTFKINPSYERIKHVYDDKPFSYIVDKDIPPLKFRNKRLLFWEFEKPEQSSIVKDFTPIMSSSTLDLLLEMEKIKALNKAPNDLLGGLFKDKKTLLIIAVIVIGGIVLFQGGFI